MGPRPLPFVRAALALAVTGVGVGCFLFPSVDGYLPPEIVPGDDGGAEADAATPNADAWGDNDVVVPGSCDGGNDPDLVAYYPLDEKTGTTASDCSGHGHDGTVISAPSGGPWDVGHVGGGFHGDGTSGCIDLGTPSDLLLESESFTIAAWIDPHTFNQGALARYIFGRTKVAANVGYRLATGTGAAILWTTYSGGSPNDTQTAGGLLADTWMHVAVTYAQGSGATLYINGVSAGSGPAPAITPDQTATVRIGCRGDDGLYFDGVIDELRVYKRALSGTDVLALAQ